MKNTIFTVNLPYGQKNILLVFLANKNGFWITDSSLNRLEQLDLFDAAVVVTLLSTDGIVNLATTTETEEEFCEDKTHWPIGLANLLGGKFLERAVEVSAELGLTTGQKDAA